MANKIISVLKDNKLIVIVMAVSLLMLLVGVVLINIAPEPASEQKEQLAIEPDFSEDVITSVDQASNLIEEFSQSAGQPQAPADNIEHGSEGWCEAMMLQADADWNEVDTQLFSQKCLEPEAGL